MIMELSSGDYAKRLGLGSVQALHKRMKTDGDRRLFGLLKKKNIGGRIIFTVDTEQLKKQRADFAKKVA